jgi:hypothetical protein
MHAARLRSHRYVLGSMFVCLILPLLFMVSPGLMPAAQLDPPQTWLSIFVIDANGGTRAAA